MAIDTDRIDDAVLALLHLTLRDETWAGKGFDPDTLGRLHQKGMIDDPAGEADSVALTSDGLRRSTKLFEAMFTRQAVGESRYPHIKVDLADLSGQLWPILRRVSYAMSDADVNEADIEQYKVEVRASSDPVAVSSRWVHVERKAD
ncbi:MAG: hypothetical protein JWR80_6586 [Bradyrhizobium sp.]|nr:hypothetical protein [Bradyrhizobium sp.]